MKKLFECSKFFAVACVMLANLTSGAATNDAPPVKLVQSEKTFSLNNGIVNVLIEKGTGEIFSIKYKGLELIAQNSPGGALGGYWSSVGRARGGAKHEALVRIDPKTSGGERAEVSCNFHNEPGSPDSPLDVDIRYSLGRGESGIYTYLIWSHRRGYPSFGAGEARYAVKLNPDVFDYMTIDKDRRRVMPTGYDWDHGAALNLKEARRMTTGIHKGEVEHKYDYSALIYEIPAYGWSSTKSGVGFWFVNPSFEYMAGGPTKAELTGHLDVNPGGLPTLLNMWLGSHYGGSSLSVAENEDWTKVVGPFLIYCNSATNHEAMWKDALACAANESRRWPYVWVSDTNYPLAPVRGVVSGQILLRDAFAPEAKMSNVWVGVTAPDYAPPPPQFRGGFGSGGGRRSGRTNFFGGFGTNNFASTNFNATNFFARFTGRGGFPPLVDWQRDARFYQFWTRADSLGRFTIRNIRPGNYTLRAIADGVLGEFTLTNVAVGVAEKKSLGQLEWKPGRFGRTLWEVGVPDRTAREFRHGDHYWQWGLYFDYSKEFPNDVNFVIGKSDWRRDWNYVQPPRIEMRDVQVVSEEDEQNGSSAPQSSRNGARNVRNTTWSITFNAAKELRGKATLRLAFCGTHAGCNVEVAVNDQRIGETGNLPSTSAMQRDGIRAYWIEKNLDFDAALLKPGANMIKLKSLADSWSQGVMYDCVRLELDESAPPRSADKTN